MVFTVQDLSKVEPLLADGPGSPRVPDAKTIHWRLPKRYLEPQTLMAILRKQLSSAPATSPQAGISARRTEAGVGTA